MRNYSWLETCSDIKIKEIERMAISQVSFRNIPLFQRLVVCVALGIPFLASLYVIVGVLLRASQVEQFMAMVGCVIGVAIWALSREARRRKELLQAVQAEVQRRV